MHRISYISIENLTMLDKIIVAVVIVFLFISLYKELLQPALSFLIAVIIFFFTGIIDTSEIVHGASNQNVILIFLLLITSDFIKKTGVLNNVIQRILKPGLKLPSFFGRLTGIVSLFSAWINNTPLVAFMIPYVYDWARKHNLSPSRVLLPLSYAAIMGGTITLIGTSTNLIVNGLAMEAGEKSLHIFDFAYVGIPAVIIGIVYLYFAAPKALPNRLNILDKFSEQTRDYLVETIVPKNSKYIGKSVESANLRDLNGLYLAQIIRNEQIIAPVSPKIIIQPSDRLFFAGDTKKVLELVEGNRNLMLPFGNHMMSQNENNIVEVIISTHSRLHLKTAKAANFRKKYDAAIIAIQRNGETLQGKIGEIQLKEGDLLLLVAGPDFSRLQEIEQDFFIVSKIKEVDNIPAWKKFVFFISLGSAFGLAIFNILSLFIGLLMVIGITAAIRMFKFEDVKKSLDFNLYIILVLALALGKAISNSGVAGSLAYYFMQVSKGHPVYVLIFLYLVTNITSMFITNAAAVSITFPIALATANQIGLQDITPFVLIIAYAGSAEFISPFGYQTNLMVYGPGGYKFKDYFKLGLPLSVLYLILSVTIVSILYLN